MGGATFTTYHVSSGTAAQTSDEWAEFLSQEKKRLRKGLTENNKAPTQLVVFALELEVLKEELGNGWEAIYVDGVQRWYTPLRMVSKYVWVKLTAFAVELASISLSLLKKI